MAEGFKLFQILIIIFQNLNITISQINSTLTQKENIENLKRNKK